MRRPPPAAARRAAALSAAGLCVAGLIAAGPAAPPADRVLVMAGGRVVRGLIREQAGGVEVRSARGSMVLRREDVRATGPTLAAVHDELAAETDATDPDTLADLAGWCHTNGLPGRARTHLVAALTLAPGRVDLLRSLVRVEQAVAAEAARAGRSRVTPAGHAEAEPVRPGPPVAAGGVSPANLARFARAVGPILVGRCGNAGCHGAGHRNRRPFRLTTPARTPAAVRRNLAAAAAFVGDGTPGGSPLVSACAARPDRRGRTPFAGTGGAASYRLLADWAAAVAADAGAAPGSPESAGDTAGVQDSAATPAAPPAPADAFDPAAFNRQFAPPAGPRVTGTESAPASEEPPTAPSVSPATPPQP